MLATRPVLRAVGAILCAAAAAGLAATAARPQADAPVAVSYEVSGTIDPATAAWVEDSLENAADRRARLAILRLDTPGGLDSSMRDIVRDILAAPMPVVVHVAPSGARAASAGLFITMAADVAAMAPQTNIGSATPVSLGGGETDEVLGRKVRNDAAAYVRALAGAHGRNADLAERMVREAVNVPAARALEEGLVDVVAEDGQALLRELDGFRIQGPKSQTLQTDGLRLVAEDMPWEVELRQALVNPTVAYLLLMGGLLAIAVELLSPGLVGPGLFGAVAFLLGLYGTAQIPLNLAGIVLLLAAVGLIVAELAVASGGLLGAAGVVALVAAGILLYDTDSEVYSISVPIAVAAGAALGAFALFAASKALAARRGPPRGGPSDLIGRPATVRVTPDPVGQVHLEGALWRATARGFDEPPPPGTRVRVGDMSGLTLTVEPEPGSEETTEEEHPP